jgi:hypothetical protein
MLIAAAIAGCGPDARAVAAAETVRIARGALVDVEPTVGDEEAFARSEEWLAHTEEAVESGSELAFETTAPCLGSALGDLRDALVRRGHDVPTSLEEAEAAALAASDRACLRRP